MPMDKKAAASERQAALNYHEFPRPGKLEIRPTKPMTTGRDLARAYSPGVAEACVEIADNPFNAGRYTAKGNLVAVITNGTAVLGLGNIGAQASKPVMEGKAVLFKKFAGLDCFDIEVDEPDPEALADLICRLEPTFGAVNLEDIKAPDCFVVERICRERMNIPVFHDDQHGTAIVVAAAETTMAVPCWSSWNTGIFIRSRQSFSTTKQSGDLMSSRLMAPNVGSNAQTISASFSGSFSSNSISKQSILANFLNSTALPSITGLEASPPMLPSPRTAVPLETTATRLPLAV